MKRQITNREVVELFTIIADMLQLKGENIHRVLAYRRGAEAIADLPRDLYAVYADGLLTEIPNIGNTLAEKIEELLTTGNLKFYETLSLDVPRGVVDIMHIPGMGPKTASRVWKELGLTTVEELKVAAESGDLQKLSGLGAKSEANILEGIKSLDRRTDRTSIGEAYPLARKILDDLLQIKGALKGDVAGSLRRWRATIGDIDILVAADSSEEIMEAFVRREEVVRILGHGPTKSSIELYTGQQVDLRVLSPDRYGTALIYFTGSKDHNVSLRSLAQSKGLSLNEHSLTYIDGSSPEILCSSENQVYEVLNLPWIAPEMRENRGEIEAAQEGRLPDLVTLEDIQGDMQLHTTWSDGKASVLEMAEAAMAQGRRYMLVTDHSHGLGVTQGLSPEDIKPQRREIDEANAKLAGTFTVLHGCEVEIKANGTLDFSDDVLAQFDIVLASMHTSLRQPREQVTERLLSAIRNPYVCIIGHPRGRLIPEREPADLDMDAIFKAAVEHDVALEINANPRRLDLDDVHASRATELGVKLTISTDAHQPEHFSLMQYGVATARRGWVTADKVVNAWPLEKVLQWVKERQI